MAGKRKIFKHLRLRVETVTDIYIFDYPEEFKILTRYYITSFLEIISGAVYDRA